MYVAPNRVAYSGVCAYPAGPPQHASQYVTEGELTL